MLHPCSGLHQAHFIALSWERQRISGCFAGFSQAGIVSYKIMAGGKCHAPSLVASCMLHCAVTADSDSVRQQANCLDEPLHHPGEWLARGR
jgi:hypothetical protein